MHLYLDLVSQIIEEGAAAGISDFYYPERERT
jgi:hypothetical protein